MPASCVLSPVPSIRRAVGSGTCYIPAVAEDTPFGDNDMTTLRLMDVVKNLDAFDEELTIYAVRPWTAESEAIVARESDTGNPPPEANSRHAAYFIEIAIAREFLEDWAASDDRPTTQEQCDRLIRYAAHDA